MKNSVLKTTCGNNDNYKQRKAWIRYEKDHHESQINSLIKQMLTDETIL